jgi:tetratricopeptide (TPR) repeat protein
MEALLADRARSRQGEILLRFALGKAYEDLGDYRHAFDHIKTAADLERRRVGYDVGGEIAAIDRAIAAQSAARLSALPPSGEGAAAIFVTGLPRSGTTVVERIIASHSGVVSAGETGAFAIHLARVFKAAQRAGAAAPDLALLARRYLASIEALAAPGSRRFVDKTLQNVLHCGLIHAAMPQAKIVLVSRHPLDSCFALFKAHFAGTFRYSYDLGDLGEYYLAYRRLVAHWRSILPAETLFEIAYEDVVRDPRQASRHLAEFLGLPWEEGMLQFHESTAPSATASAVQVRRPLYATSVGKWRHHADALAPLRSRLARELPAAELD